MRVLVCGSYPPDCSPAASITLALVRERVRAGDDVEVLSPTPTAAHHDGVLHGWRGAWTLLRGSRHHDCVVVHIEDAIPLHPATGRWGHALESMAMSVVLRAWRRVEFVADDLTVVPRSIGGRSGRLLWRAADQIVVSDDASRAALRQLARVRDDRIRVEIPRTGQSAGPPRWQTESTPPYDVLVAEVQRTGAIERREDRRRRAFGDGYGPDRTEVGRYDPPT